MQPEQQHTDAYSAAAGHETQVCPGCQSQMLRGMRFCRYCGYRLGEGVEEYAATMRLPNSDAPSPQARAATARVRASTTTNSVNEWGALAASPVTTSLNRRGAARAGSRWMRCSSSWSTNWFMWVVISIAIMTAVVVPTVKKLKGGAGRAATSAPVASRSYFGVNEFEDFEASNLKGALIDHVTPPGSPADKAGLVGGDVITGFNGRPVSDEDDIMRLLRETAVGSSVAVEFVRDGETRRTTLTTISKGEMDRLIKEFDRRPGGKGFFGVDVNSWSEFERVFVPGANVHGVRLEKILKNNNAYIAGLRDGDVVVEFDGVPVRTSEEFFARVKRAVPDSVVRVVVWRGGERLEIPFKVGYSKD